MANIILLRGVLQAGKISPEDMMAFCRSMSVHSSVLYTMFDNHKEVPGWQSSGAWGDSMETSPTNSMSSLCSNLSHMSDAKSYVPAVANQLADLHELIEAVAR